MSEYGFHGWVVLLDSEDDRDELILSNEARALMQRLVEVGCMCTVHDQNSIPTLLLNGHPKRRREEADIVKQLVKTVVAEFDESYGVVYYFDAVAKNADGVGVFSVDAIRAGRIEERMDPFLSPMWTNKSIEQT